MESLDARLPRHMQYSAAYNGSTGFQIDGTTYRLGHPGGVYRLTVFETLTTQAPPSAYIAGLADGPGVTGAVEND